MENLYKYLFNLPSEVIEYIILKLMKDEKISFSNIATLYTEYLETLKKGETEKLMNLRGKFIELWASPKKNLPKKMISLMQEAKNDGWANISQEQIDNSKWNKLLIFITTIVT